MRNLLIAAMIVLVPAATACGGGSGSVLQDGGGSTNAGFTPAQPSPGTNTTSMEPGPSSGEAVSIQVGVTDTQDVYGASFVVEYDPAVATFLGWRRGSLLERDGHAPTYTIDQAVPGQIVVGVSRNGNVQPVDVSGTAPLVVLDFRMTRAGVTELRFSSERLYDGGVPPQPLPNVSWFGGSLHAN